MIVFERERLIHQQQEALRELSTPVLQIRDRLLILPIIGVIDTQRARQITESLLQTIRSRTGVTALHVTHSLTEARALADKILMFQDGQVVEMSKVEHGT